MEAIHRLLSGDDVRAAGLIPLSDTQRKLMRAEMKMTKVSVLSRHFSVTDGYIDIHMTDFATNIHIYIEPGGGLFYDFVATDHVTNRGDIAYDPELYNGGGKVITVDGISIVVFENANTTIQAHGAEIKFKDKKRDGKLAFPLSDPTLAPLYGKKLTSISNKGICSSSGLNNAPSTPKKGYTGNSSVLTRMHMSDIYNVQAAPEYKWYDGTGNILVVSGLKSSSSNTMAWTQEAMGDFPSRKYADGFLNITKFFT